MVNLIEVASAILHPPLRRQYPIYPMYPDEDLVSNSRIMHRQRNHHQEANIYSIPQIIAMELCLNSSPCRSKITTRPAHLVSTPRCTMAGIGSPHCVDEVHPYHQSIDLQMKDRITDIGMNNTTAEMTYAQRKTLPRDVSIIILLLHKQNQLLVCHAC